MTSVTNSNIVYIDSDNRTSGVTNDFLYNLTFPDDLTFDKVVCLNALIPKSFYMVPTEFNKFQLLESGITTNVYMPAGNYVNSTFANVLGATLTNASSQGWVYTVSYPNGLAEADTGKWSIKVSGNISQPALIIADDMHYQLGLEDNSTNYFIGNQLISTNVIKLNIEDRLYVKSNLIDDTTGILFEVNLAPSLPFSTITYTNYAPEYSSKRTKGKTVGTAKFTLIGQSGNIINLNGLDIQMTLLFYKESQIYTKLGFFLEYQIEKDKRKFQNSEKK
jgi:hypothetical protein